MARNFNPEKVLRTPVILCFAAMICCALWGSAFPFIKIGYELFDINAGDTPTQLLFAGIRFALAGVLVIIFGSLFSRNVLIPRRENLSRICLLALFQTILQYTFFYIGLAHTTGTKSSVINSTSVFFAVIISCLLRQEKLDLKKMIGCIVGFAGTVIINLAGSSVDGRMTFSGEGMILLSSISYAVSSVLIKHFSQNENTVTLSGYQFTLGGAVMIVFGLVTGGRLNFGIGIKGVLLLLYLAFLSAAAFTLWGILLKYNDVSRVAVFGFMTPVFGCIFSAVFLGENLADSGIRTVTALLLVCIGIIIVHYKKKVKGDYND